MPNPDLCSLCNHDRAWHDKSGAVHRFTSPAEDPALVRQDGRPVDPSRQPADSRNQPLTTPPGIPNPLNPFGASDIVLRLALVEAGVISPDQLEAAQTKLSAIRGGGVVHAVPRLAEDTNWHSAESDPRAQNQNR